MKWRRLYPAPQTVVLNTKEGYKINPFTGDSIQPIVNSLGETIKTGVPVPVKGKVIHLFCLLGGFLLMRPKGR